MSWQEELRQLDEELASGRLSADDYRVRRDQVLSSAVGQPDAPAPENNTDTPPPDAPPPDATQVIPPISPAQSPQSPPQGFPQQPQSPPQGVPQQQLDAERTQAVSSSWQSQPPGDDRTQFVQPPASPPGGFPQAGGYQQGWQMPEADQAPPWGGGDLPPLGPSSGEPGWAQQGPESFDDKPSKGKGAKIAAGAGALVLLAVVAIGAFLLWGQGSGGDSNQPAASSANEKSSSPKAPDPLAVADFPGKAESHSDITTFNAVSGLNYLNSSELSTYSSAGAGPAKYVVHHLDNGNTVVVLVTQVNSPTAAQNAANELLNIQIKNGGRKFGDVPKGVHASAIDAKDGDQAQIRGHYAHGNVIVRIEVKGQALQNVQTDFSTVLSAETQVLPADG